MSRHVVTGATGFLGRHVVEALRAQGHQVVAIARGHEPRARGDHKPTSLADLGAEVVRCDVLDTAALTAAMKGADGVFHCAGKVSREADGAAEMHRVNVGGARSALQAARAASVKRFVLASTSGTVGISEDPDFIATEDSPTPLGLIQRFPYYRTKLFAEEECLAQEAADRRPQAAGEPASGLSTEVVAVNPSLLLGPGDVFGSSTGDVRLFLEGSVPATPAGGLSFVDARDAAAGMLLAMEKGKPGQRYLLGGCNLTVEAFFGRLSRLSGVAAPRLKMPRGALLARASTSLFGKALSLIGSSSPVDPVSAEMGQLFWYIDSRRAEKELGWKARDPGETLRDTIEDLGFLAR